MSAPLVLVVEHDRECPLALLGDWLTEAGCELDVRRPYAGDQLPADLTPYDGLLLLGGPMGANDDLKHAWLGPAKELVREAVATDVPTLGVCLGHQLAAVALGGTVERNPHGQQVGLLGVGWTDAAKDDALLGPLATPRRGVQWNDDVVTELPPGATLLAVTGRDEVQAVRFAPLAWGVQLHPEVDVPVLQPWAESDRGSHESRGIDTDALLRDIGAARDELDDAWRPLADGFTTLARGHARGRARR
ncbi:MULTISPECIES: type 1 glutamine amidotransferase [unclassified Nocardioides]|uniref:type 1 glutamine amidotransferase n=1 Tax=unclassified Nocardioides TaxID=2615069 RepID=UPI0009EFE84F|nr:MULTISPECIES: type 1 glutamine amidotransferase [unclassified Nocardioides]GAW50863.1 glutamine amidotransferase [Nocardioides sp. PD653-B2]GAW54021.1 glutamine amidotransferase [Nocardioides sp. PD653]